MRPLSEPPYSLESAAVYEYFVMRVWVLDASRWTGANDEVYILYVLQLQSGNLTSSTSIRVGVEQLICA